MATITTIQFTEELLRATWPLLSLAVVCVVAPRLLCGVVKWVVLRVFLYASKATIDIYQRTRKATKLLHRANHVYLLSRSRA
jgi:hypothetical protein